MGRLQGSLWRAWVARVRGDRIGGRQTNKRRKAASMTLITYDPAGVFLERGGIRRDELAALAPRLAAARDEVLSDAQLWASGGEVPEKKRPLDAGFFEMPERLLAEYRSAGSGSEV